MSNRRLSEDNKKYIHEMYSLKSIKQIALDIQFSYTCILDYVRNNKHLIIQPTPLQSKLFEMKALIRLCSDETVSPRIKARAKQRLKHLSEIPYNNPHGDLAIRDLK